MNSYKGHLQDLEKERTPELKLAKERLRLEGLERQRAEEALQESEDRYRDLVEHSLDLIFTHDLQGGFLSVNPALVKLLGYDQSTILNMNVRDILAPEVRDQFSSYVETVQREKAAKGLMVVQTATGGRRIIEYNNTLRTEGVVLPIVRSISRDVTERNRAERALQKSEQKFRELFDNAPVGYQEYDMEGRISNINRTQLEMMGYSFEEMIGQPVWKFVVEEETIRQAALDKLTGMVPPGQGFERPFRRKDGTTFPVLIQDRVLRDVHGRITGMRSTVQDMTEWKKLERENTVLEEQLRQSQKMEAIGHLAGVIAHDFNNLLTVIKGYSEISLAGIEGSNPLNENLTEIKRASERAVDLTRQLLAFSRRQVLEMRVLDLNAILKGVEKMLRRIIGEDIELVMFMNKDLGKIKTDPGQIEQVILNLAVNARDAMPSGGKLTLETANVELTRDYVRTHLNLTPGAYVMLSVTDTGVGMPPEVRERIFEPFFTTKEKGKGTGLGLSTVYGIVKQSEGYIWVDSEPVRGTTFKIYFPVAEEELEKELQERVGNAEIPKGEETILIVEDDEAVRKMAALALGKKGYSVLVSRQAGEALNVCRERKEPIQLILTDVVMPQMSGPQLVESLRQVRQGFKVLYMSGYTDDAIDHHGVLEKGVNFIQKPFSIEGLAKKVREVLDN